MHKELKMVVLGSGGTDKSALTVQFVQGPHVDKYDATIEDSYRKQIEVDGNLVMLEILDTAGTEQFSAMRDLYMKNGEVFVLCFSVIAQSTFNDIPDWLEQTLRVKDVDSVPFVLVGTKCELENQRVISKKQGENLAKELGGIYIEASVKNKFNVDAIFKWAVRSTNLSTAGLKKGVLTFDNRTLVDLDKQEKHKSKFILNKFNTLLTIACSIKENDYLKYIHTLDLSGHKMPDKIFINLCSAIIEKKIEHITIQLMENYLNKTQIEQLEDAVKNNDTINLSFSNPIICSEGKSRRTPWPKRLSWLNKPRDNLMEGKALLQEAAALGQTDISMGNEAVVASTSSSAASQSTDNRFSLFSSQCEITRLEESVCTTEQISSDHAETNPVSPKEEHEHDSLLATDSEEKRINFQIG